MRNKTTQPSPENFEATKDQRQLIQDEKDAYKAAERGKRLASHVSSMMLEGVVEDRAKMGRFPNRYPGIHSYDELRSIELATNGELHSQGIDATVDLFDAGHDSSVPTVALREVGGEEQPHSSMYQLRVKK